MVKIMSLLIKATCGLGFSFGVRAWTEMEIWCVKGIFMLKFVSSDKQLRFKGFKHCFNISFAFLTGSLFGTTFDT